MTSSPVTASAVRGRESRAGSSGRNTGGESSEGSEDPAACALGPCGYGNAPFDGRPDRISPSCRALPHSFRIPELLCLPLLRKKPARMRTISNLDLITRHCIQVFPFQTLALFLN